MNRLSSLKIVSLAAIFFGCSAWILWVSLAINNAHSDEEKALLLELSALKGDIQACQAKASNRDFSVQSLPPMSAVKPVSGNVVLPPEEDLKNAKEMPELKSELALALKNLELSLQREQDLKRQLKINLSQESGVNNSGLGQWITHELAERGPWEWSQAHAVKTMDWTTSDAKGRSPWLRALATGNMPMVEWLYGELKNHADQDFEGHGPMHYAIFGGVKALDFLMAQKFNLEAKNHKGQTALMTAILQGQKLMMERLIFYGADIELADQQQRKPLHYAALGGQAELLKTLVPLVESTKPVDAFGMTPLHLAVQSGKTIAAEVLLKDYSDINPQDNFGCPPLFYAVQNGDLPMVHWLARRGAILTALDRQGRSAVHYAVMSGKPAMVELLVSLGLSIRAVDNLGRYPLHLAVVYGNEDMVQILLNLGADPTTVDFDGRSSLWWSEKMGRKNLYKLLGIAP